MDKIETEILRLIEKLHDEKVYPSIHGTKLILFGDQQKELTRFIKDFSVIKDPKNIRQILLWKLNMVAAKQGEGRPLSSIDQKDAETLYNCIFDQRKFLDDLNTPINIVLFRRGSSGQHLTNILKTLKNINTTILVSGTDDSKSWYNGATVFHAPGLPSAGKAIVALANNRVVKEFLSMRIKENADDIVPFQMLVERLKAPSNLRLNLIDPMKSIFTAAMRMTGKNRDRIANYLNAFLMEYRKRIIDTKDRIEEVFPLSNMPLRSLVILGAYYSKRNLKNKKTVRWQAVIEDISNKIAKISPEGKKNKILFLTDERQRLVALDEDGFIYLSEIAIKNKSSASKFLGIWLLNDIVDKKFVHEFLEKCEIYNINREPIPILPKYDKYKDQILNTTLKIDGETKDFCDIAQLIDQSSSSGSDSNAHVCILKEAETALREADLILYSDKHIETSVGAALIVPGAEASIKENPTGNKLKILLSQGDERETINNFESVFRYVTGRMKYKEGHDIQWHKENINDYVDYVVRSINKGPPQVTPNNLFNKHFNEIDVFTQYYNSDIKPEHGTYPAKALSEIIIGLLGMQKSGFIADQKFGLFKKSYIKQENDDKYHCAGLGLFQTEQIKDFVQRVRLDYVNIIVNGGFVFDVDMTLLPKKAEFLTDYPTLAYYIMLLLRDEHKVGIISGNSEEEQIPRIVSAIRAEMKDYESSLKNLTFYVDGGATKIEYDAKGNRIKRWEDPFNQKHAMEYSELKRAVDAALVEINKKHSFNLSEKEKKIFMEEAEEKYPELNLKAPWEHEEWKPTWITPNELIENYKKIKKPINIPWIEIRGEREGKKKVASIAIKPTPQIENKDIRGFIQATIEEKLGAKSDEYLLRSGGTSTTDITLKNADKTAALKDFIKSNSLTDKYVYYFGDEFYHRPGNDMDEHEQVGNDEVIAKDLELKNVNKIAVNLECIEGANERTTWIGRSPQAVLEFLEQIIPE